MALPPPYIEQMTKLLGLPEAEAFLRSFQGERAYGLRLNPLKTVSGSAAFREMEQAFQLEPVPWCPTGYYYSEASRPGKHPYHAAGLYYIQEPSAMSAAELLAPAPGETVLDLAAAPGGKTSQIAGKMNGSGLLIANEIHPARAKIVSENVERLGIRNAVVTSEPPDRLSARFPAFFDRIMLDAPCSGEGMFRKDPDAVNEWSPAHVDMCAARQADILDHAAAMLKPGGALVYSTCTFNRVENEDTIAAFLARHPSFELRRSERIWPHLERGEGHFVALLAKSNDGLAEADRDATLCRRTNSVPAGRKNRGNGAPVASADLALFQRFAADALPGFAGLGLGAPLRFGDALYWLPHDSRGRFGETDLQGLRVARPGLHLGDIRKGRFEPAYALAMHTTAGAAAWVQSYPPDAPELSAYLRGETLPARPGSSGWGLVAVNGQPLGWGKSSAGQVKNHLPKGLRRP
ncbi:RNA methyltransferase [Paenibacillus darwinianus]|uniref:RNA methyltransferase n=1 Tax=Paenibacillus darwinianus TaxID=1380763 RepID=A0A9W5RZS2_9BACL|nr:RsmB/NOP family class I SAM-dependent RNA methyltransferase [Paenibacillus darwinianus]EXX86947.1 RNA methyltransferase [Paenibacillus darwinianus]EXX87178.1 RNA methyltransferase [Paenibacillus darwinianus]EXX87231.1 RNA methyltransferase [Paenibacillus darwinianus]